MQKYKRLQETIMSNYMTIKWIIGQILRIVQSSKTEPGRNRNYEQPNYKLWSKISQKTKAQDQKSSQVNSMKHLEKG